MASPECAPKSLAFIHNTNLPHPLGVLSTAISAWIEEACIRPKIPFNYDIILLDLADYDLESQNESHDHNISSTSTLLPNRNPNLKSREEWQQEISKHSAFILLFPYHTWSHCHPLKNALSPPLLSPNSPRKPILLTGFGKQEPSCQDDYNSTWKRKSFPMMRSFFKEQGMKVIDVEMHGYKEDGGLEMQIVYPEFQIHADYWEDWITGGYNAFIGGQQGEAFEGRGWNRVEVGMRHLVDMLEGKRR